METLSLRAWINAVKECAVSAGFLVSPAPFSAQATPKGLVDRSFTINLQSKNTGEYRDDDYLVRAEHVLTISILKKIKPLDQFDSLLEAADIEAALHEKMLPRTALPETVVTWESTRRSLTGTREHMIVDVNYVCNVDFPTGATPQE